MLKRKLLASLSSPINKIAHSEKIADNVDSDDEEHTQPKHKKRKLAVEDTIERGKMYCMGLGTMVGTVALNAFDTSITAIRTLTSSKPIECKRRLCTNIGLEGNNYYCMVHGGTECCRKWGCIKAAVRDGICIPYRVRYVLIKMFIIS